MITVKQLNIRPFNNTDADYKTLMGLMQALFPDLPQSLAAWKHSDAQRKERGAIFRRFFVEHNEEVVSAVWFGERHWSKESGSYFVGIGVFPTWQRQGIGRNLYNWALTQLEPHQPARLFADTREDQPDAMAMLDRRGFTLTLRELASSLHVKTFDATPYAATAERVAASGIHIRPLSDIMATDPEWQREMYELKWALLDDVPSDEPRKRPPLEEWAKAQFGHPSFRAEGWFVAEDTTVAEQPCYIGLSHLYADSDDSVVLETGMTGVIRSYRRRGIATALKLRAIAFAKAFGANEIETDNEENNPMYQLNVALGFRPKPAWVHYKKELGNS